MLTNLINNIAFLIALVAAGQIVISRFRKKTLNRQALLGLLFGGVAVLGMANPVNFSPGVFFDGRSIVLSVAGVVGGGLTAAIAAGMAAFYRYQLGGSGAPVGIMIVLMSALLGVLARQWWRRRTHPPRLIDYLALGVSVQVMQLAGFTQVPNRAGYAFIEQAWWVLLLFYPLATMLVCMMLRNYEQQLIDRQALQSAQDAVAAEERASMQRFHAYFDHSIIGLAISSLDKGWLEVNDALCNTLGYTRDELTRMTWPALSYPQDLAADEAQFNRMLAGEIDSYTLDKRFIHKAGHLVDTRLAVSHVRKADGSLDYVVAMVEDISERKRAEEALRHEKQFSEDTLNALPGVFYMFDASGRFVRWNHEFSKVSGYTDAELATMQGPDFFAGEDRRRVAEAMQRVFAEGQVMIEAELETKDGRKLPYHFNGRRSIVGDQTYLLGVGVDISEQRRTQQALETERTHLHTLVSTIPDLIWLKDVDGRFLACNSEFEHFVGAAEADILGKTDYDFLPKTLADLFREHDLAAIAAGEPTRNEESIVYASDGRRVLLETTKVLMRTPGGRLIGVLGIGHDITERRAYQEQLEHVAHFDALTGLPNRVLLADRLQQAMAQAQRHEKMLAVAYLDLDGFKAINDQYGHQAGDQLLTLLSGHMKHALREGDTLARLGGDEFIAVLLDLPDVESSAPMLSRLLAAAGEVFYEDGNAMRVSASLGVTFYPQAEAVDADQLLRQADQAMYQAKLAGRNRYHIFDAEQDRSVRGHHENLDRLKQALDAREFVLHYQPKVNMRTGRVIGAEALIRWQHPERGLLLPAVVLPPIADHPLAIAMGEWVLDNAMTQIEIWRAAGLSLPVSVNIDAIQLAQVDFVERLRELIAAHPAIGVGDLELEVLETSALEDIAHVSSVILACREIGIGFALDDFGTGYSSLTYLKRLPAHMLKIDQSFVHDMLDDPDDLAILNGILGLASAFRSQPIAEGVETLAHGKMLLQLGCELAQGFAIARPMPAEDLPAWVATWRAPSSWLNQAPINRDDLPILFAWVEHRAWIIKVVKFIQGEAGTPPPMQHEQCRVGQWMIAAARLREENRLAIEALRPLHIEIHDLAHELICLKAHGGMQAAMARVSELYCLRDRLLAQLLKMLGQGRTLE